MSNEWLLPLQADFLERFFATDTGQRFFLTGGTALAVFHLHHRVSVDLDLFTLDDLALREVDVLVPQLAADLKCRIGRARRTEHLRQFLLESERGEPLQVDFVREFGPQYGDRFKVDNVIVDSLENIATNKITALLGRTEPKDFVDLYFILQETRWNFGELLAKAQEKDLGLRPFYLAGALLQVRDLRRLPETTPPVMPADLRGFFIPLADWLIDQSRPSNDVGAD